jgi:hypothetical protein
MKRKRQKRSFAAERLRRAIAEWVPAVKYVIFEIGLLVTFTYGLWTLVGRETGLG